MDKLKKIMDRCKGSVSLFINDNLNSYKTVKEELSFLFSVKIIDDEDISQDIKNKMIEHNTMIQMVAYPDTPVGSYHVWHYDLQLCINEMYDIIFEYDE